MHITKHLFTYLRIIGWEWMLEKCFFTHPNQPIETVKLPKVAAGSYFITTLNKDEEKRSIQFFIESK